VAHVPNDVVTRRERQYAPVTKQLGSLAMKIKAHLLALVVALIAANGAQAQQTAKPNILVIFGDDIGQANISAYTRGVMGYRTPNIDRLAREGMMFTDYYAEQSCTAGRSSFITGQATLRTGLSKVGLPGAALGLQPQDITSAQTARLRHWPVWQEPSRRQK
jgi:arylsulfatase